MSPLEITAKVVLRDMAISRLEILSLKKFLWLKDSSTIFCDKGFQVNFVKKYFISHTKDDHLALCGVRKASLYLADLNSGANDEDNYFYSKASPEDSWL